MDPPASILVVDDDLTNIVILRKALTRSGYSVLTAVDGDQAVEIASRERPDLILLDIMMPRLNGLQASAILKAQEATASIPILFVTAQTDSDRIIQAFEHGGVDYITKPIRVDEVLARVSVHIRLQRTERELAERNAQLEELARQLEQINMELSRRARHDGLTDVLNRGGWGECAALEHERSRRHGHGYGLIMLDVDCFKALNDKQGHQAGDECLIRLARCITSTCRSIDLVGRYGGEEFVVLAPETDEKGIVDLAERLRAAIWALALPHPSSRVADRVTMSLGTACSGAEESLEQVIKAADSALYGAKAAGRNRVCSAGQPTPSSEPAAPVAGRNR